MKAQRILDKGEQIMKHSSGERLDYLKHEHASLWNKIALDRFILATHDYHEDEKVILKERIQHMEWVARDYLKQVEAILDSADVRNEVEE